MARGEEGVGGRGGGGGRVRGIQRACYHLSYYFINGH